MLQLVLILVILGILLNLVEFAWKTVQKVGKWLIAGIVFILYLRYWQLTIPATVILCILYKIHRIKEENEIRIKKERQRARNKAWLESNQAELTEYQVDEIFSPIVDQIYIQDSNECQNKFTRKDIPYGRVNAFLNYFERSIYTEEPYYFSSVPSLDENEFREYGFLITRNGIFVSKQYKNSPDESLHVKNEFFSFSGLKTVSISGRTVSGTRIVNQSYDEDGEQIVLPASISDSTAIKELCQNVVDSKVSTALFTNSVISDTEVEDRAWEAQEQLNQRIDLEHMSDFVGAASIGSSRVNYDSMFAENKHFMNGSRGNGYAAEYANNTFDRLRGMNVENAAQNLDSHGRQVKNGADRIVSGQEIQTKYYKTASESIGAAFEHKQAKYIRSDGSGKMMQIEVPRDQYAEAVKCMQKRIDSGQVPNVEPGENAARYVRKGVITYAQSFNAAKAGTIEGLVVDSANGIMCTSSAASISSIIVFAQAVWNGSSLEDAAKIGLETGLSVLGKGMFVYTVTMQLSREQFANYFVKSYWKNGEYKGFAGVDNPIYKLSENLASDISKSRLAQSKLGQSMGLNKTTGQNLVANSVTAVVVFGPDICKALAGRISVDQLIKNSIVGASGLVGAAIGNGFVPFIGGMVGGAVGGFIAKNVMDGFIEDDAKKMFRILKEEFLDGVMLANLTKDEFEEVVQATVANEKLNKMLQNMYASGEYRRYAREAIVDAAIIQVYSKRTMVTDADYDNGVQKLLLEIA